MSRRVRVLAEQLASLIDRPGTLIDVGCGDGTIAAQLREGLSDLQISGIDIMARPRCAIPMQIYDGTTIPLPDNSVDYVLFTDVLHHTDGPIALLREARRVCRYRVLVKDHVADSWIDRQVLALMDWVGNRPHGVVLPYNYLSSVEWSDAWKTAGLRVVAHRQKLGIYPAGLSWLFDRALHFVAALAPVNQTT